MHTKAINEKYNVLVVDDDASIRECMQEILMQIGNYQADVAESPFEGLAKIQAKGFDIVISDIKMPKMDGIEFLKEIKEMDSTLPVVMVTGFPTVDLAIQSMKEGASDFITKPFRYEQIKIVIEKLIRERKLLLENVQLHNALKQKETIEALNKKLHEKIKQISILYAISESFLGTFHDDEMLYAKITEMAAEITGATFAMIMLIDRERGEFIHKANFGLQGYKIAEKVSFAKAGAGKVIHDKVPFFIQNHHINPKELGIMNDSFLCNALISLSLTIKGEQFAVLIVGDTKEQRKFNQEDADLLQNLTKKASLNLENKILYESIYENLKDTFHSLVAAVEARDQYTLNHSIRVTNLSMEIAKIMGCGREELDILNFSGYLHDIGKIGISDRILLKPGKLSEDEYEIIKTHPIIGENILKPLGLMPLEKSVIRHHHEKWDGQGYPDGLAGERIPLLSRIIAVADSFDAMTTDRPYRKALSPEDTILELKKSVDQFDKKVIEAFLEFLALDEGKSQIFDQN